MAGGRGDGPGHDAVAVLGAEGLVAVDLDSVYPHADRVLAQGLQLAQRGHKPLLRRGELFGKFIADEGFDFDRPGEAKIGDEPACLGRECPLRRGSGGVGCRPRHFPAQAHRRNQHHAQREHNAQRQRLHEILLSRNETRRKRIGPNALPTDDLHSARHAAQDLFPISARDEKRISVRETDYITGKSGESSGKRGGVAWPAQNRIL